MTLLEGMFNSLPELSSERLILRRLTMRDAEDMFVICSDPSVSRYVLWPTHRNIKETKMFLRNIIRYYRMDRPAPWGIEAKDERRLIGTIGFVWIHRDNNSAEVGYSLGSADWNKGYATEALQLVLRYGFSQLHLNRIEAQHDTRNRASGRVMEKAGMIKEGVLRERIYCKGEYMTVDVYSMLMRDYF